VGVFAGGDIVTGAATVIEAMGAGRKAARGMKAYLGLRDTDCVYVPDSDDPAATRFGILLTTKIFLFVVMLSSALVVTIFIGPKMRQRLKSPVAACLSKEMTGEQLSSFDGKEGRPAYIAYKGMIYDISSSRLWKNGQHMMKHQAGTNLTDMLKNAPHGDDKVFAMPQVGMCITTDRKPERPFYEKVFYTFAYMNLILVFVIIFVISLWRWW
jgi:predicted heme/steroid binding protein